MPPFTMSSGGQDGQWSLPEPSKEGKCCFAEASGILQRGFSPIRNENSNIQNGLRKVTRRDTPLGEGSSASFPMAARALAFPPTEPGLYTTF